MGNVGTVTKLLAQFVPAARRLTWQLELAKSALTSRWGRFCAGACPEQIWNTCLRMSEKFAAASEKSKNSIFWGGFGLAALVILTYLPAVRGGFIWDDDSHLTQNPCIIGPLGFKGIWTSPSAVYYPLVLTSFWIGHALWGFNPLPYHLVNILMHAACGVLLWRVLRALRLRGAWLGAMLWALHPAQAESAAWITELKNTQSCLFYLLAILFFVTWRAPKTGEKSSSAHYALALVCAVLAILSKSSTVMLPVVMGLCAWWMEGRWRWSNILALAPLFLISAAGGAWTIWEQQFHSGALGPEWHHTLPERVVIAGKVIWFYLGKLIWPHPLIFIYPRWRIDATRPAAFLPTLAAAVLLVTLWWRRDGRARPLFFAFGYFVVSLLPVLGFFRVYFFRYSYVSDHFQYLAGMGPLALAGGAIMGAVDFCKSESRWLKPAVVGALALGAAALTWQHEQVFQNPTTLWTRTLEENPDATLARVNLAAEFVDAGHPAEALAQSKMFLDDYSDDPTVLNIMGSANLELGHLDAAIDYFQKSIAKKADDPRPWYNLGLAMAQKGRMDRAEMLLEKAAALDPGAADVHYQLAILLLRRHQDREAASHLRRCLEINPADFQACDRLAWILATSPEPALRHGPEAVELALKANYLAAGRLASLLRTLAASYAEFADFPQAI
jgi:protein O-mannosyl-transferase